MNEVFEALAHPTRRQILALLRRRDMTAGELAAHFPIAKPTLSGHLRVLRAAGLVQGDRNGTSITYHVHTSVLEEAMAALLDLFGLTRPRDSTQAQQRRDRDEQPGRP